MDARKAAVSETSVLHFRDANEELLFDEGKPVQVVIYGPGSKTYAKAQAAQNNRMIDKIKSKGKSKQSAEEQAAERAEFLADITKSFENLEYEGLTDKALFKAVYSDVSIGFFGDQVAKHAGEWANFTKGSATT